MAPRFASETLGKDENILLQMKPDLLALAAPFILSAMVFIIPLFVVLYSINAYVFLMLFMLVSVSIAFTLVMAYFKYLYTFYVVTNDRIIYQAGIISRDYRTCKFDKIQNTYIRISIYERLLGVGNILFSTAGESGIEISFDLVRQPLLAKQKIINAMENEKG
jgi:uncharacterized membrane protein YdbT with pleckstrin-like domain